MIEPEMTFEEIDRLIRNRLWQQLGWSNERVEREIERQESEEDREGWGDDWEPGGDA